MVAEFKQNFMRILLTALFSFIATFPLLATDGDEIKVDGLIYTITSEENNEVCITGYTGDGDELSVPNVIKHDGRRYIVTSIGKRAFNDSKIKSINLPNTVTSIGERAFYLSAIESITIPNSVTRLETDVFRWCFSLKSVKLPTGITSIPARTFFQCVGLREVIIPESVKLISHEAFFGCTELNNIIIPNSVEIIESSAFYDCGFTRVEIPASVEQIEFSAFGNCNNLTEFIVSEENQCYAASDGMLCNKELTELLVCPSGKKKAFINRTITAIGDNAFSSNKALTEISVDTQNPDFASIDGMLCDKELTTLIRCPQGKMSVGIPESIVLIGNNAFMGNKLTRIKLPNSILSIGKDSFRDSELEYISIGNRVESIGDYAFCWCHSLQTLIIRSQTLPTIGRGVFSQISNNSTLWVPSELFYDYCFSEDWIDFKNIREIPEIVLNASSETITLGGILQLEATIENDVQTPSFDWKSSDERIVTVTQDGLVKALSCGTADVTVSITLFGVTFGKSCSIEVIGDAGMEECIDDFDNQKLPEYYDLNGIRLNSNIRLPGIYIKRQGRVMQKVLK